MENSIPFRGALSEIPIHRPQSLARARFRETLLEDGSMIRAHRCSRHACRARLVLYISFVEGLRTHAQKVTVLFFRLVCRKSICQRWLRSRTEGLCGTTMHASSRAYDEVGVPRTSLLVGSHPVGCQARVGRLSRQARLSWTLRVPRGSVPATTCQSSSVIEASAIQWTLLKHNGSYHLLDFEICPLGAIGVELLRAF